MAIAQRFAREDFAVALMARREESLSVVREEIEGAGGTALAISADAADPTSVGRAFDEVREKLRDPEVFVYNAGNFQMGGILELTPEQFDDCFRVNCSGPRLHRTPASLHGIRNTSAPTLHLVGRRIRPTRRAGGALRWRP